ncbi:MAG: homoserine dehydrogenase [Acidobacteriota bacterium]|nr:homoserine dehydrogenase [Acidobacteriota bacterium]
MSGAPGEAGKPRPCRVAIVGFGTVGQAVARLMLDLAPCELQLVAICNRDIARKRADWIPSPVRWTERIEDVLTDDVDVVVELIGGRAPAEEWIRRALEAGKSVVTANKQVIAHAGPELLDVAARSGSRVRFEAAVAGGVPVVRAIEHGLAGDRLTRVAGILNGTCNYILSRMEEDGVEFCNALAEAQALGFAEADPSQDIEGFDAQAKLAILAHVALHAQVRASAIQSRPIDTIESVDFLYAQQIGCTIRQIAWAERTDDPRTVRAGVGPALVPAGSPLASVRGSENLVMLRGQYGGETTFGGLGAGGEPTAVAVMSDLLAIAREGGPSAARAAAVPAEVSSEFVSPYYVRFTVADRPGIIATLATVFARHDINIDAILQQPGFPVGRRPFVVSLDPAPSPAIDRAMREIAAFDFHGVPPVALPVLSTLVAGGGVAD